MAEPKTRISIAIDRTLLKRLDRVAKTMRRSRSLIIGEACGQYLDGSETFVKLMTDPVAGKAIAKALMSEGALQSIAKAIGDDMTADQLRLFERQLNQLTKG